MGEGLGHQTYRCELGDKVEWLDGSWRNFRLPETLLSPTIRALLSLFRFREIFLSPKRFAKLGMVNWVFSESGVWNRILRGTW